MRDGGRSDTAMGGRIRQIIADSGLTRQQFCAAVGVAKSTLANYLSGSRAPDCQFLQRVVQRFGISPDWLLTGDAPVYRSGFARQMSYPGGEVVHIPAIDPVLEAPFAGLDGLLREATESFAFSFNWLARLGAVDRMFMTAVAGDCMEPLLKGGDLLLVDSSRRDLRPGAIHVLAMAGGLVARRVDVAVDGLSLQCENPSYPRLTVPSENVPGLHVLGRVIWAGKCFLP